MLNDNYKAWGSCYSQSIKIKSKRQCDWLFFYLCDSRVAVMDFNATDTMDRGVAIKKSLDALERGYLNEIFIKNMMELCDQALLPDKEFEWIDKKNERLCYFAWCHLLLKVQDNEARRIEAGLAPVQYIPLMRINSNPTNIDERHQAIIDFFDKLDTNLSYKRYLNEELKASWQNIYNFSEKFKWLDKKDQSQCDWAWDYLYNYLYNRGITHYFLSPTNPSDKHGMVIASFDIWSDHPAEKKLFIVNMKKAWGQKKYRDSLKGKKAYNIVMDVEIKSKLDHMAKRQGKKINETLEWLINQECDKNTHSERELSI